VMYEYSITFVRCQLYILLLIKCMFVFFFLFLFLFATFHGEIKISKYWFIDYCLETLGYNVIVHSASSCVGVPMSNCLTSELLLLILMTLASFSRS